MHKLKSHPNLNPNRNHKQKQRRRQQEKRYLPVVLRVCLWFIYLFIISFDWLLPVPLPHPTHASRLKLNSCIMNKFIVAGFRVSIYLVATLRGLCSHQLWPPPTNPPTPIPIPIPAATPTWTACKFRGLVKNKNNNESRKCVLISVSCSWQIILPHFICTKPDRREAKGSEGKRIISEIPFHSNHRIF